MEPIFKETTISRFSYQSQWNFVSGTRTLVSIQNNVHNAVVWHFESQIDGAQRQLFHALMALELGWFKQTVKSLVACSHENHCVETLIISCPFNFKDLKRLISAFKIRRIKFHMPGSVFVSIDLSSVLLTEWIRSNFIIESIETLLIWDDALFEPAVIKYLNQNQILKEANYQKWYPELKKDLAFRILSRRQRNYYWVNEGIQVTQKHDYCWLVWVLTHYLIRDTAKLVIKPLFPCCVPDYYLKRWIFDKIPL